MTSEAERLKLSFNLPVKARGGAGRTGKQQIRVGARFAALSRGSGLQGALQSDAHMHVHMHTV